MVQGQLITTWKAATLLGYSVQYVRLLARIGQIRATKFGRDWLIDREAVVELRTRRLGCPDIASKGPARRSRRSNHGNPRVERLQSVLPPSISVRPHTSQAQKGEWFRALPTPVESNGIDVLRKCPILSGLDGGHLSELFRLARERRLKAGQFVFFENDPVESCYVVAFGMVKTLKHSPSGKDFISAICGPGEMLGGTLLVLGQPHICSGQAITDARVFVIGGNDFLSYLREHHQLKPKIVETMLDVATKRYRSATTRLGELATERTETRLARLLFTLCSQFGPTICLTRREIAEIAGTTTETAIRFMSQLRQAGVVKSFRGKVVVLEQDKLRLLAQVPSLIQ